MLGAVVALLLFPMPLYIYLVLRNYVSRSYHMYVVPLREQKRAYTSVVYRLFFVAPCLEPHGLSFPRQLSRRWGSVVSASRQHPFGGSPQCSVGGC